MKITILTFFQSPVEDKMKMRIVDPSSLDDENKEAWGEIAKIPSLSDEERERICEKYVISSFELDIDENLTIGHILLDYFRIETHADGAWHQNIYRSLSSISDKPIPLDKDSTLKKIGINQGDILFYISYFDQSVRKVPPLRLIQRNEWIGKFDTLELISLKKKNNSTLYPLWFGTNRKPVDPQDNSKGFSGERDNQLHYGTCKVTVPESHQIGSTGSAWWQRLLTLTDDRLKLKSDSLQVLEEIVFWENVRTTLQEHEVNERSALVFIHGFNVSFEDAAKRAAQLGFDLQVRGIMAFYSWPSKGNTQSYGADAATIEDSEEYIAEFLLKLAQISEIEKIHIIAHSMGNRGLLRVMQSILAQVQIGSKISFGQIFLAAPDVDKNLFGKLAKAYSQLAERTTLYVSAKDKALASSGIIHKFPRAGYFPPITVVNGIDTVEVSGIDVSFVGHGYYAEHRILLEDLHDL